MGNRGTESRGSRWDCRVVEGEEVFAPAANFDTGFFWGQSLNYEKLHHQ